MSAQAGGEGVRAQPFYCPYCGEQDIRPQEERAVYHCRFCDRLWRLQYRGMQGAGVDA